MNISRVPRVDKRGGAKGHSLSAKPDEKTDRPELCECTTEQTPRNGSVHFGHSVSSEAELRQITDRLYRLSNDFGENGIEPNFTGLLELAMSEPVIVTAIHRLKKNRGANTPGTDNKVIADLMEERYEVTVEEVQNAFRDYKPSPVRRVLIPKPGSKKKRPLGIPSAIDKIVQQCLKLILEPICEARFFEQSYGFRPWRDTHDAVARVEGMLYQGYHWVVEGDIQAYFDTIHHGTMMRKLWEMGIRDQRVLAIIRKLLKAGVMIDGMLNPTEEGTPQGGILSPVLANVYLNSFDWRIANGWERKPTKRIKPWTEKWVKYRQLTELSNLKPGFLVRYADDWVILTKSEEDAKQWLTSAKAYLENRLKLKLSDEKTLITDVRKQPIKFVGFEIGLKRGKGKTGWVNQTGPRDDRLITKMREILRDCKDLRRPADREDLVNKINLLNSKILGITRYYEIGHLTFRKLRKWNWYVQQKAWKHLAGHGGMLVPAKDLDNLIGVHSGRSMRLPAIEYEPPTSKKKWKAGRMVKREQTPNSKSDGKLWIGMTSLTFTRWKKKLQYDQELTPYTPEGRQKAVKREGRKSPLLRADELLSDHLSRMMAMGSANPMYNFEYFMNRAYAFNRDKGKCAVCAELVYPDTVQIHHKNPKLPLNKVNKVPNLITLCTSCHQIVHGKRDDSRLDEKAKKRLRTLLEQANGQLKYTGR